MSATIIKPRRQRVHRSELAVPATSQRFFVKAAQSAADAVFLDVEDAVSPEQKISARGNAISAVNEVEWGTKTLAVRVNGLDTEWGLRDIYEIASSCERLDMIVVPKTGTAFDVQFVDGVLTGVEREQKREKRIGISALIETPLGLVNVEEIAASSDRLEALIFGIGDYSISMRTFDVVIGNPNPRYTVLTDPDKLGHRDRHWNDQWHFARARIANACRAFGMRPIDGPYTDYSDPGGFRACAERAAALGFEGKWAIHPSQIAVANDVFSPTLDQVQWAHDLLAALRGAMADGQGAIGLKGVMIDMAHEKLAQAILERARLTHIPYPI
jgi:malyl-CoA/(S)-citramalyl-CoA lyase